MIEHQDARGERHHRAHDVLDQKDGQSGLAVELAQGRDHAVGLGRPQPRHHFVEQQEPRLGRERAGDFEPLAIRQRQRRGELVTLVEEVEPAQQRLRVLARRADIVPVQQRADDDVVLDAERRKRPHQLEGAGDAAPAHRVGRQAVDRLAGKDDACRRPAPSRRRSC